MAFSEDIVKQAWQRASERCECKRERCGHYGRCNKYLLWISRGAESDYGWEAHHRTAVSSGGSDTLDNCEILCQMCHKNTGSYGG